MLKKIFSLAVRIVIIWIACHIPLVAHAENHALLIGIGKYKYRTLEGPPYDVAALSEMLATQLISKKTISIPS